MYQRPPTPDEIYHHGILGQKWGVRRYQNKDGTLTAAGRAKKSKSLNKEIARMQDWQDDVNIGRSKTRARIERRQDKKIDKAYKRGDKDYKVDYLKAKKEYKLKSFDDVTRLQNYGYDKYKKVISDYRDVKIKAVENKGYKKTFDYKNKRNSYLRQVMETSFNNGGMMSYTALNYSGKKDERERQERINRRTRN